MNKLRLLYMKIISIKYFNLYVVAVCALCIMLSSNYSLFKISTEGRVTVAEVYKVGIKSKLSMVNFYKYLDKNGDIQEGKNNVIDSKFSIIKEKAKGRKYLLVIVPNHKYIRYILPIEVLDELGTDLTSKYPIKFLQEEGYLNIWTM